MKRFTAVTLIFCLLICLIGCGKSEDNLPEKEVLSSPENSVLTVMALNTAEGILNEAVEAFSAENDYGITIELITADMETYKKSLATAAAANEMPDIFFTWEAGFLEPLVENGRVLPIEELSSQSSEWYRQFEEGVFDRLTFGGEIYAIPLLQSMVVVFYSKSVFTRTGTFVPETWDEFLQICQEIKNAGITPLSIGGASSWHAGQVLAAIMAGNGGADLFNALSEGSGWSDERLASSVESLANLYTLGYTNSDGFLEFSHTSSYSALQEGTAAMIVDGDWVNVAFRDNEDIGAFLLPAQKQDCSETAVRSVDQCYAISSSCANQEAALAFLQMLTGEDFQLRMVEVTGQMPATNVALDEIQYPLQQEISSIYHQVNESIIWIDRGLGSEAGKVFNNTAQAILSGEDVHTQLEFLQRLGI